MARRLRKGDRVQARNKEGWSKHREGIIIDEPHNKWGMRACTVRWDTSCYNGLPINDPYVPTCSIKRIA